MKKLRIGGFVAFMVCAALAGCNNNKPSGVNAASAPVVSPLLGTWTGKSDMKDKGLGSFANALAGGPLTGPSSMKLQPDGTGFLKVADQPERPISWRQEDNKVILQVRNLPNSSAPDTSGKAANGGPWVGTLSDDRRTIKIDFGQAIVTLNKQEGA